MTRNLTMMTDLYQLTMANGYYLEGIHQRTAVFDLFFRPCGAFALAVSAGLSQAIEYIQSLHFDADDLAYLRSLEMFDEGFLSLLAHFGFCGNIYSVAEGEIVFPDEPILVVEAPLYIAQIIETALLNIINHQTLIATKARQIVHAADGRDVVEFGLRRAQAPDAGIYGSRAAHIGGCVATSNVLAGQRFGIPVRGTMSHSWVQAHIDEQSAFQAYARHYPDSCLLLVDTYDTLRSGIPNAIRVFDQLVSAGHRPIGVRIDSGDLAYLSKAARKMLDEAGHSQAQIFASGDIDEHVIMALCQQRARIDAYGVGTRLITSADQPSLGGVYKLVAIERDGVLCPSLKVSDSATKLTNPGRKDLCRIYDRDGMAFADLIMLHGESLPTPLTLTHPRDRWKQSTLTHYTARPMLHPIFVDGQCVYQSPSLSDTVRRCADELTHFWDEYKRLSTPQLYKVDLSDQLYQLKTDLLQRTGGAREQV